MKNYICEGKKIEVTLAADTPSGAVVKSGAFIAIAIVSGKIGEKINCDRSGVFTVPKKAADAPIQGTPLYWDTVNKEMTVTAGALTLAGHAYEDAAGAATSVKILLLG